MIIIFIVYESVMYIFIIYTLSTSQKELEAANYMYSFIHLFLTHHAILCFNVSGLRTLYLKKIFEDLKELLLMMVLYINKRYIISIFIFTI